MGVDQLQTMIVKFCPEITECKEKEQNSEEMMLQSTRRGKSIEIDLRNLGTNDV